MTAVFLKWLMETMVAVAIRIWPAGVKALLCVLVGGCSSLPSFSSSLLCCCVT